MKEGFTWVPIPMVFLPPQTKIAPEAVIERWVFPKASVTSDDKGAKEVSKSLGGKMEDGNFPGNFSGDFFLVGGFFC